MDIATIILELGQGMLTTIRIFVLTLVFSLPLGFLIYFGRVSKNPVLSWIMRIYIAIMRGTPLMLQLIVIYFGPYYIFGVSTTPAYRGIAVIIAFSLNYAAYFAEIYRSGFGSIPQGQYEAAEVLGYSKSRTFFAIVLPQVWKRILPSITNEVITLVKDTSLSFSIAYAEMFTEAKALSAAVHNVGPLMAAGVFYFIFNAVVAWIMARIEKSMSYYSI